MCGEMDGRGGCCIARYSGNGNGNGNGGGEISYGMSKIDRIMLKFRPIAPKPMTSGSGSGANSTTVENNGRNSRRKRKYIRVNGNKTKNSKNTFSKKRNISDGGDMAVTLPLMSETPDRKEKEQYLLSFNNLQQTDCYGHVQGHAASVTDHKVEKKSEIISFVTMECVTETWLNGDVLGFTDQSRMTRLEMDTCPTFITNCHDMVVWTNKAYRKMTAGDETMVVKKYNRVTMPVTRTAFTCKMKVTWGMKSGLSPSTLMAPCDVVSLRSGGFAWRLDVKAALSLGR